MGNEDSAAESKAENRPKSGPDGPGPVPDSLDAGFSLLDPDEAVAPGRASASDRSRDFPDPVLQGRHPLCLDGRSDSECLL